jgi:hypothetical protein
MRKRRGLGCRRQFRNRGRIFELKKRESLQDIKLNLVKLGDNKPIMECDARETIRSLSVWLEKIIDRFVTSSKVKEGCSVHHYSMSRS